VRALSPQQLAEQINVFLWASYSKDLIEDFEACRYRRFIVFASNTSQRIGAWPRTQVPIPPPAILFIEKLNRQTQ
jgi:hypothetical protein